MLQQQRWQGRAQQKELKVDRVRRRCDRRNVARVPRDSPRTFRRRRSTLWHVAVSSGAARCNAASDPPQPCYRRTYSGQEESCQEGDQEEGREEEEEVGRWARLRIAARCEWHGCPNRGCRPRSSP